VKSALFVDFDNVYSGLRKLDQTVADRFARQPLAWITWIVQCLELPEHVPLDSKRRVLVRRCYLNPQAYQRFRPSFNLAGFEIIDCPALTSEGKTSTDIHMVLDIIDLLQHETRYDEFIVFSADADFTPVLRKLRRWDRRTTVLAIGFPSAAYRASADLLIDQDDFIRKALGFKDDDDTLPLETSELATPIGSDTEFLARACRDIVEQTVDESTVAVPLAKLAAKVLANVKGMDASTWAGHGSFRELLESWNLASLRITSDGGGTIYDPQRHSVPSRAQPDSSTSIDDELKQVVKVVHREVANSSQPVPCSRLASVLTRQFGSLAADWNGQGTFRKFVETLNVAPLRFDWSFSGGSVRDPARHPHVGLERTPNVDMSKWDSDAALLQIATQIHEVSSVPLLSPTDYQLVFTFIAKDLKDHQFDLKETGKRVRDALRDAGGVGSRLDVNWVLRGLLMRGHEFGKNEDTAESLSRKTANNVRSLCLREQMLLDRATDTAILRWFGVSE
jgi:hypothetical protein